MTKLYKFGHKPVKRQWDSSEIDKEMEDKKMTLVFLGLIVVLIIIFIFLWWMKNYSR